MTLAVGIERTENFFIFAIDITLMQKVIKQKISVISSYECNKTLLGAHFIKITKMLIDISNNYWFHSDYPNIANNVIIK